MYPSTPYTNKPLRKKDLHPCPFTLLKKWIEKEKHLKDPNAAILATVNADKKPSTRVVLIKKIDPCQGLLFFTHYNSPKGKDLHQNPHFSLSFYWPDQPRQCHVRGRAKKCSYELSDNYFLQRTFMSQVVSYSSQQSQKLISRKELEESILANEKTFAKDKLVPRPPHWGGYWLLPESFEFWKGGEHRLHDRFLYTLVDKQWSLERLQP